MGALFQNILGFLFFVGMLFVAILISTRQYASDPQAIPAWLGLSFVASLILTILGLVFIPEKKESAANESIAVTPSPQVSSFSGSQSDSKTVYLQNYHHKGDTVAVRCYQSGGQVKCEAAK